MRAFLAFVIGIVLGAAAVWYFGNNRDHRDVRGSVAQVETNAQSAAHSLDEKLRSLHLSPAEVRDELARSGRVIRDKAGQVGHAIADATADARITATIKARLIRDPDLSAWNISVSTTAGVVTLSGAVSSDDQIGKAVVLAMDTDGVKQVISTLQVKPK